MYCEGGAVKLARGGSSVMTLVSGRNSEELAIEAERLGGELAREGVGLLTSGFVTIGGDEGEVRGARPRRGILLSLSLSFLADVVKSG